MGEMADFALDCAFDDEEHYMKYMDAPISIQYEEGLIDESSRTIGKPFSTPVKHNQHTIKRHKYTGPGPCPICGSDTVERTGIYGKFFGCTKFPKCRGNRSRK